MNITPNNKPKTQKKIYFMVGTIFLLIIIFIFCCFFLITSNLEQTDIGIELPFSDKIEEQTLTYLQEKYNVTANIKYVEDVSEFYNYLNNSKEKKNKKAKLIYTEIEDKEVIVLYEKEGKEYTFYDNYESNKYEKDLEMYFKEKLGINTNVTFNIGKKCVFGENLIHEKYTETFEMLNNNDLSLYVFLETPDDLNIQDLTTKDFPEIFNNTNIERKIIIGKTYTKNDIGFVSYFDMGLSYTDMEFDSHLPQYAVYYKEFKLLTNTIAKYYNYNKIKDGQIYILTPEVIENINLDNEAMLEENIENLSELKLRNIQQLSGKYTFKIKDKETAYIAIHREDFGILDASKFYNVDAVLSLKGAEYERGYGMPIGDYLVFTLYPRDEDINMFIFKEFY